VPGKIGNDIEQLSAVIDPLMETLLGNGAVEASNPTLTAIIII